MKYVNAQTVLPPSLIDEIRKYVQGELIYIPKMPSDYLKWGANTDTKSYIAIRNGEMIKDFKTGISISKLAELYYLSEETIKKIVYRR